MYMLQRYDWPKDEIGCEELMISCYHSNMAQLLVRQLDEDLKVALQHRAKAHGRSTEEEVRDILRNAVLKDKAASAPLGTAISVRFSKLGLQADIPELRGNKVRPANLK